MSKNCHQDIYSGATIRVWTEEGRTYMQILNNHNKEEVAILNVIETTLLLSDNNIPELGCNLYFFVKS